MFRLALIGLSITIILPAIKSATGCCAQKRTDIDQGAEEDIYLDDLSEPNEKDLANFLDSGERQVEYDDQLSTLEEYPEAEAKLVEASIQVANIMDSAKKGDNLDILAIKGTVQPMLDSIIKNVDALLWMLKLNDGQQTYQQAIENSVLAMAFGRHLGLNMSDIRNLAVGMLLLDVGKLRINPEILNKTGLLTREEFEAVKQHVNLGVKMLKSTLGINRSIITMVETHHERYDGSGYPRTQWSANSSLWSYRRHYRYLYLDDPPQAAPPRDFSAPGPTGVIRLAKQVFSERYRRTVSAMCRCLSDRFAGGDEHRRSWHRDCAKLS